MRKSKRSPWSGIIKIFPHLIICEHCDSVYRRPALAWHEVAHCERCRAVLSRARGLSLDQWLALTIAAAIVFVIANAYPVIQISLEGQRKEATLLYSVFALTQSAAAPVAAPVALAIIVAPLLQIVMLGWVLAYARAGQRAPAFSVAMKVLNALRPWSMVEVCLLGALVSIIKLSNYVDVVAGIGIWATGVLTVLITIIASQDTHRLWELFDAPLDTPLETSFDASDMPLEALAQAQASEKQA